MHLVNLSFAFAAFASAASSLPTEQASHADKSLRDVVVFPNGTWVENIAVRSNGNLLVTLFNVPEVWEVEPRTGSAELVYSFPNANVSLGIAEVGHDIFAVNVGSISGPGQGIPGSWSIWTLDYNTAHTEGSSNHYQPSSSYKPTGKKVAAIPPAVFLNGLATLPTNAGLVLTGDSFLGQVFAVDTLSGRYSVAVDVPELKRNTSAAIQIGVNGIRVFNKHLYFVNSFKSPLLAKIPLSISGRAAGPVKTIAKSPQYPIDLGFQADDFALDATAEYAWITTNPSNVIVKLAIATGKQQVVGGGKSDPTVAGATSAAFGRNWYDKQTLYIVTDGGLADPTSAGVAGGKIVALDTTKV
ncbi:quino amine dehydrogenase beta chain [Trichoderma arundinaceum]|uniref:Quino amine dehydrogenase beta chain n=1 Tax=Trichoderma arundinaceum TaxID=490622 RepID=A0A395P076_TRIAR|nr:quino amine dehydrogenase beta chain [Trichoderma arundinaceum]